MGSENQVPAASRSLYGVGGNYKNGTDLGYAFKHPYEDLRLCSVACYVIVMFE